MSKQAPVLITRQSLANEAAHRWREQYKNVAGKYGQDRLATADQLDALGPTPDPDRVDAVIGNGGWTRPGPCSSCRAEWNPVVQVGEAPDYESATAYLCADCLNDAVVAMGTAT